jgi:TetR/AcrR family transcriptional repressor of nem operon
MTVQKTTPEQILDCARTLILHGGYNAFSYADVAERVGIRKASIHHHFATKEELVRLLVARYRAAAQAGLVALEQQVVDAPAQLASYVGYWRQCIADQSAPMCLCALLASELPVLPESIALEVRAHFRALSAWLAAVLERGAKAGRLRFAQPAAVEAEAFMAAVHGAMLSARAYADPQAFVVVSDALLARLAA